MGIGEILKSCDDLNKCLEILNKLIEKQEEPKFYIFRALIYKNLGEYEKCISDVDKYIELTGGNPLVWNLKGQVLIRLGKFEEAIEAFDKSLEILKTIEALFGKYLALVSIGRYKEGYKCLEDILKLSPNDYLGNLFRLRWLVARGGVDEALLTINKLLSINPKDTNVLFLAGILYLKLKNYKKALEYFKKVLDINPNHIEARIGLAMAYEKLGDHEKAVEHCNMVFESYEDFKG